MCGEATGVLQTGVYQLQAPRPAEARFAADFVGEAEDQGALSRVRRKQRRYRCQALGEQEDFGPAAAGSLVLVYRYRSAALSGPVLQWLAVIGQAYGGPFDVFNVQEAFGGFAPWARHVADNHHAQAGTFNCLFDA